MKRSLRPLARGGVIWLLPLLGNAAQGTSEEHGVVASPADETSGSGGDASDDGRTHVEACLTRAELVEMQVGLLDRGLSVEQQMEVFTAMQEFAGDVLGRHSHSFGVELLHKLKSVTDRREFFGAADLCAWVLEHHHAAQKMEI
eukprot:TRINITY_DN76018_c0_g1_i1.p1 TRINITY_DN76018_c0_g1~~TRINITY_DN76018_c0_g1_i1.p1  ORF type:complete len:144 (-),score=40.88 TRINITY_DN76018_c0_g1_i1:440-871(-)